jgi:hypothetical protein
MVVLLLFSFLFKSQALFKVNSPEILLKKLLQNQYYMGVVNQVDAIAKASISTSDSINMLLG